MARQIVEADIEKVNRLVSEVIGYTGHLDIARMGGLTNHTYRVRTDAGEQYVVRIPGDGTEDMIDRSDEQISTELACRLNIDAKIYYFGKDGSKVTQFIPDAVTMSPETMTQDEHIRQAAQIYRTLHTCGVDTGVRFDVFDMAASYERIIRENNVALFDDYEDVKNQVMEIKQEIDRLCAPALVPCHNDPLCENWVLGSDRMYLIDWEYAGMNDPMWDLADISIEAGYGPAQDQLLLTSYYETDTLDSSVQKHMTASKIYVDYLWTLWAKTRVPFDGQPMEDWATERYERLKSNLTLYKAL